MLSIYGKTGEKPPFVSLGKSRNTTYHLKAYSSVSPSVWNSPCPRAHLPGPTVIWAPQLSCVLCLCFLPRAALDCSPAHGYPVPGYSEKPKGSFTQMFKSPRAGALGEGTAQLSSSPAWYLPQVGSVSSPHLADPPRALPCGQSRHCFTF